MRLFISFLCLILLVACHNKSDLKRIADLEKVNKIISDSLSKQNKIIKLVYDSLIEKQANPLIVCGFYYNKVKVFNNANSDWINLNSKYKTSVFFTELKYGFYNYIFRYAEPSKRRLFDRRCTLNLNSNNSDDYISFEFTPKDTGWYYWNGEVSIRNDRTGMVANYPITDSFYVYQ